MNRHLTDDRFAAALTLAIMIGSTVATCAAFLGSSPAPAPHARAAAAQLPTVEITGRRDVVAQGDATRVAAGDAANRQLATAAAVVRLPTVTVIGRRAQATVAAASAQRVRPSLDSESCIETTVAPAVPAARTASEA